jgi:hypothetical protein
MSRAISLSRSEEEGEPMPEKDPNNYTWITYAWVVGLSVLGGIASFWRKMREGVVRRFNITELIGEIFIAMFTGIVTFYMCESSGITQPMTSALVALSAHMGSRALYFLEKKFEKIAESMNGGK